jgi:lysophospholipid acyltransferase
MSFTVAPFVILYFYDTILVWGRLYFYGVVIVAASFAFFASPAKGILIQNLKKRGKPPRAASPDAVRLPTLGLPNDPGQEIEEAMQEITSELKARRRKGSLVEIPSAQELKTLLEAKLGKKL